MGMDKVFDGFLRHQYEEGMALAASSDLLDLSAQPPLPFEGAIPRRYLARFSCTGLIRPDRGDVYEANRFEVVVWFHDEYLRYPDPTRVLSWLWPIHVYHPNIRKPYICVGQLTPRTSLVELLYQCFEVITFQKVTMQEHDALNAEACAWARANRKRFPVDSRPLKRRRSEPGVIRAQERSIP